MVFVYQSVLPFCNMIINILLTLFSRFIRCSSYLLKIDLSWIAHHKLKSSSLYFRIWTAKSANYSTIAGLQIIFIHKPAIGQAEDKVWPDMFPVWSDKKEFIIN